MSANWFDSRTLNANEDTIQTYRSNLDCMPQYFLTLLVVGRAVNITETHASKAYTEGERYGIRHSA